MKLFLRIVCICLCAVVLTSAREPRMLVRIPVDHPDDVILLRDLDLDYASHAITDHVDVVVTQVELSEIKHRGFQTEIIQWESEVFVPPEYHTFDETWALLDSLHQLYPSITELDTCGYSQRFGMPIPRFIISQNPQIREDEPAVLIDGMHHAREPIGNEICLHTIKWILQYYPDTIDAARWVDSMEVQFVPMVNPEGWKYITDSSLTSPWWRKNLRDNGNNGGPINPDSDGVDLNRNYDWRWTADGSPDPRSWVYRGPYPGSESEVQALVSLARQRKFVVGISYHSYGYIVLYPWSFSGQFTPDEATLQNIAWNMAAQTTGYTWGRLSGSNMSSVWQYGEVGIYDFLIETAMSFIPPPETILIECDKNFKGIRYLLNRTFYSGITGHVRDSLTLEPLSATIEVLNLAGDTITPRTSDSLFGRYYRLLENATNYSMRFSKQGYIPKTISGIDITSDSLTRLEVLLNPGSAVGEYGDTRPITLDLRIKPNPFRERVTIEYSRCYSAQAAGHCEPTLSIYDAAGRLIKSFPPLTTYGLPSVVIIWDGRDDHGNQLEAGVYFYRLESDRYTGAGKIVLVH